MSEAWLALPRWGRMSDEMRVGFRAECRRLYEEEGLSVRGVAEQTGRSYGAVHQALLTLGVQMRPRGNPGKR